MILVGATIIPGTATSWITVSFVIMLTSQYYIKRRYCSLFVKYNYLVSTALDSGTSLMVFFIAMFLYGGASGQSYMFPAWWGNRTGNIVLITSKISVLIILFLLIVNRS